MPTKTPAAILIEQGKPMVIDEIDLPDPGPTQILIRQFASGVCHSQLHELHRPNAATPLVLGHESTGVVTAVGSEVTHVSEGDHVMVTWVPRTVPAPGPVVPAAATYNGKQIEYGAPAYTGTFTWARDTLADQQMVVPMSQTAATDVTAIVGCAVMTGAGAAVHAAEVRPGDSVAIVGVGGVGLSIVAGCANLSADPIIAVDLSDEKLEFAKHFGATIGVNASKGDPVAQVREIMGGGFAAGVDHAFDAIGIGATMSQVLNMARARAQGEREGGQAILVGVPHGEMPVLEMRNLFGGKVYRGAPGGCCIPDRDFPLFIRWFEEGKLDLNAMVTRRYPLEQINEACDALAAGEIAGRAILEF